VGESAAAGLLGRAGAAAGPLETICGRAGGGAEVTAVWAVVSGEEVTGRVAGRIADPVVIIATKEAGEEITGGSGSFRRRAQPRSR
jgi:hypothetical protein